MGEASVSYDGAVFETDGEEATHRFVEPLEFDPGGEPIAGADVRLCVCTGGCDNDCRDNESPSVAQTYTTSEHGRWSGELVFGGMAGSDSHIGVRVEADGYEEYYHTTVYGEGDGIERRQENTFVVELPAE